MPQIFQNAMLSFSVQAIAAIIFCVFAVRLLRLIFVSPQGIEFFITPVAKNFLSPREQAMLDVLEGILPHCRVHAQVSMGALLSLPRIVGHRWQPGNRNTFAEEIVDFVVQDRASGRILVLIDLDDYNRFPVRDRDRNTMTARAGYRTIRISALTMAKPDAVRRAVASLLPSVMGDSRAA